MNVRISQEAIPPAARVSAAGILLDPRQAASPSARWSRKAMRIDANLPYNGLRQPPHSVDCGGIPTAGGQRN